VKIRFYAHASFRLEADGLAVITDPYTPGPHNSGFDPIDEPADVVIMSSATDPFDLTCCLVTHCVTLGSR
jgi:L-ascorbate metabolism protein UlaG (beta-lactamase superfamily)